MYRKSFEKNLIHLDCTLRDGGYYNNWDFEENLINDYLKAISYTSINFVEIGFRSIVNNGFKGALAFSTDDYINSLKIPRKIEIAVMINGSELLQESNYIKILEKLFPNNSKKSPVKLVRIACHLEEINVALESSKWLVNNGFKVGINLMQISEISKELLISIANKINDYPIDVFYFADSLGNINPEKVKHILNIIKIYSSKPIGIHAHDNLGLALSNTISGIKNGAEWIDSTITGMGRGPGNCKTEELLIELEHQNSKISNLNISHTLNIINKYFLQLKEKYKWGTNPYYYLSGKYKIHPTYIQTLLNNSIFSTDDRMMIINKLSKKNSTKFDYKLLTEDIVDFNKNECKGYWNPDELFKEKIVLIIATGPSAYKYRNAIERYIRKIKPKVIALNTPTPINNDLIDIRAACHPLRILTDADEYKKIKKPIICPYSTFQESYASKMKLDNILDYGLSTRYYKFDFQKNYCNIPRPLVLLYAISAAISGNAKSIKIAGVDGYEEGDPRNSQLEELLTLLLKEEKVSQKIKSITPSLFKNINQESVYYY